MRRREFIAGAAALGAWGKLGTATDFGGDGPRQDHGSQAKSVAVPSFLTAYGRAGFRLEARTSSQIPRDSTQRRRTEEAYATAGIQARWIQMVDNLGSPLIENPFIPCVEPDPAGSEVALREWVAEIKAAGMAAMSWHSTSACVSGWQAHPEWRQQPIVPIPQPDSAEIYCCVLGDYGRALIDYCVYAVGRLGLDGLWFDGVVMTPIWQQPYGLTCACAACQQQFREATGSGIPVALDWDAPGFREWVKWRFEAFSGFLGRLAHAIREAHPEAAIVYNHYHRPGIPWRSAVPIDRYDADIITGSEAFSASQADVISRLNRAYGRGQAEVWRNLAVGENLEADLQQALTQHALVCCHAGAHPSFGQGWGDARVTERCAALAPIINAISPYLDGRSLSNIAMHVSQQTETFYHAPGDDEQGTAARYWASLSTWTEVLGRSHLPVDYVFDADFAPEQLSRYAALLMPLSVALSEQQAEVALDFARRGGTLLLGMGAGACDEWGLARPGNPLGKALGFEFTHVPDSGMSDPVKVSVPRADGTLATLTTLRSPMALSGEEWETLLTGVAEERRVGLLAARPFGKGRVFLLDTDVVHVPAQQMMMAQGGSTGLRVTNETAASGRYSLRYADGPEAPQPFYPDIEWRFRQFGAAGYSGGRLEFDVRVSKDAVVCAELRASSSGVRTGPSVTIGPAGRVMVPGREAGSLPVGEWCHVVVDYRFATADEPATWALSATGPGADLAAADLAAPSPDYSRTDWFVLYGAGTQPGEFTVDNLKLLRVRADGTTEPVIDRNFEDGPEGLGSGPDLASGVIAAMRSSLAPYIECEAPPTVRLGYFGGSDGRVMVHLLNGGASRVDWLQPTGPEVVLRCPATIREARLATSGASLSVHVDDNATIVRVPPIGLYQVVELR